MSKLQGLKRGHTIRYRKHRRAFKAQSMLEFALVLPLLLFVSMAIFDFGRALYTYAETSNSIRRGLRYGAILGYDIPNEPPQYAKCQVMLNITNESLWADIESIQITYLEGKVETATPAAYPDGGNDLGCNETNHATVYVSDPDLIETTTNSGDMIEINVVATVDMITPLMPVQQLTFNLRGQRTLVKAIYQGNPCGDFYCDVAIGENSVNCYQDCNNDQAGCFGGAANGLCASENSVTCPADCWPDTNPSDCGDGFCDPGETAGTCIDCADDNNNICEAGEFGTTECDSDNPACGDAVCDPGESAHATALGGCAECAICENDVCEAGEELACPDDCAGGALATCGDTTCEDPLESDADPVVCTECIDPAVSLTVYCGNVDGAGNPICDPGESDPDNPAYCAGDCPFTGGGCDGGTPDGTCDIGAGETLMSCVADCGCGVDGPAGDGICDPDSGETAVTCPADCGVVDDCNDDTVCDPLETYATCPNDCQSIGCGNGICEVARGEEPTQTNYCPYDCPCDADGICDASETVTNCEEDCSIPNDGVCSADECKPPANAEGCSVGDKDCSCGDGWCSPDEYPVAGQPPTCADDCDPCSNGICAAEEANYCDPSDPNGDCKCGNDVCDTGAGESSILCPGDCKPLTCPNGTCEPEVGEDFLTCGTDEAPIPGDCEPNTVSRPKKFRWWAKEANCTKIKGQATNADRYPAFKWKKLVGATSYEVWGWTIGVSPDPEWVLLGIVTSPKCTGKNGTSGACITTTDGMAWWNAIPITGAGTPKVVYYRIRACSGADCGPFTSTVGKVCLQK
jgi:hypothetical protein